MNDYHVSRHFPDALYWRCFIFYYIATVSYLSSIMELKVGYGEFPRDLPSRHRLDLSLLSFTRVTASDIMPWAFGGRKIKRFLHVIATTE